MPKRKIKTNQDEILTESRTYIENMIDKKEEDDYQYIDESNSTFMNNESILKELTPSKMKQEKEETNEWKSEELKYLISSIQSQLPSNDTKTYSYRLKKVDWNKVYTGPYSIEESKAKFDFLLNQIRTFKNLSEILKEIEVLIEDPLNLKSKPKKPLNPYFLYVNSHRKKYSLKHPTLSMPEISKALAEKFHKLDDIKKQKYIDMSNQLREEYDQANGFDKKDKKRRRSSKPKLMNPFSLYLQKKIKKHPNEPFRQIHARYKEKWKNELSDESKLVFINKALEQKKEYDKEVEKFCILRPEFQPSKQSVLSKAERRIKDKASGKPERPPSSGYHMFTVEKFHKNGKDMRKMDPNEKMAHISSLWKILPEDKKNSYIKKAKELNDIYKESMKKFLEKMTEEEKQQFIKSQEINKRKIKKKIK